MSAVCRLIPGRHWALAVRVESGRALPSKPDTHSRPFSPRTFDLNLALPPGLGRFLDAFRRSRGLYAAIVGTVFALSIGVSLVLPVWFRAEATLLPPPEGNSNAFGTLAGLIQSSALGQLGLVTTATPSDVFAEILKSRTLHEAAIRKFRFDELYKLKGMDRTLRVFRSHLIVDVTSSGIIAVSFEDRDPVRAAEVTNFLVDELDRFNREAYNTRGQRTRVFLDQRLADVMGRLSLAERALRAYETKNKVIAGSEGASLEGMANVLAQKMNLQIRRSYLVSVSSPESPALRELDAQLAAVNRELSLMPELKLEGTRLALDLDVQRKLVTLLTAQLEDARIQETQDIPTVAVMDRARAPELKERPKRALIVLAATTASVLLCAAWTVLGLRESRPV